MASSRRTWRPRLVWLVLVVLAVGGAGAVAMARAASNSDSSAAGIIHDDHPPPLEPPAHTDPLNPRQLAIFDGDRLRASLESEASAAHSRPYLTTPKGSGPGMIVLPDSPGAYDLGTIAGTFPQAFTRTVDGGLLITRTLLIAPGATLVIDSRTVPRLALLSNAETVTSIWAVDSTLQARGASGRPVAITSATGADGTADTNTSDGRAYVVTGGGVMDLSHVEASDLGFGTGRTSGVAWMGRGDHPATGGATDSTFQRNFFGAYASDTDGLTFDRASFLDNIVYGFDPHTGSNHMRVTQSVAARNGRHGFIASRDCSNNEFIGDESFGNGGAGFMIDDGNADSGAVQGSNGNLLSNIWSHDNAWSGVVIEGGQDNTIEDARVRSNPYGVWIRNGAAATRIDRSWIVHSARDGLRVDAPSTSTAIADTHVDGARVGINIAGATSTSLTGVHVASADRAGMAIEAPISAEDVTISGSGPSAITADGQPLHTLAGVDIRGWMKPMPADTGTGLDDVARNTHLGLVGAIMVLPLVGAWPLRRRRARLHRSSVPSDSHAQTVRP